ncbi:hypothetical protein LSH36_844g00112 [Paralvinella palmiformis]|uniref:Reverse transcriptase domain-containing protein n=1 Tax=Paralvinella palmiformis TaxID=53620 RepID=A0AAD9MRT2_9ANNE|nr:hypothetical protein LSH36_844g00112 [Paralvinella palmiformis]
MKHFDINEYSGSVVINEADTYLQDKANDLRGKRLTDISVDNVMIASSIAKMKIGSAPGFDGVMTEHLKGACNTNVVAGFRSIFNIYLQFGIVPSNFRNGLIIPTLKKPQSDTSVPNNYRPVTISPTLFKLMEIIILSHTQHQFSDAQFGFIEGRGTQMAITLSTNHDDKLTDTNHHNELQDTDHFDELHDPNYHDELQDTNHNDDLQDTNHHDQLQDDHKCNAL